MCEIECFRLLVVLRRARVVQSHMWVGFNIFGDADALFAVVCGMAIIYAEASDKLHAAPVRLGDEDVQGLGARFDQRPESLVLRTLVVFIVLGLPVNRPSL